MAKTAQEYELIIALYEQDGPANLFYALNRKANEMAKLLNKINLANLDVSNKDDKSFDRLKILWNEAAGIGASIESLGRVSGITGDEASDTTKPTYRKITTPESMADQVGELAGKRT